MTPTRDRILTAARRLFVERGLEGVSMRAVAARVRLTPMALYRHFRSKDALLEALVDEGHGVFLRYLQRSLAEPSPEARLARAGREYLNFGLDQWQHYRVMFMMKTRRPREASPARADMATFRFLVDRIRECMDAGVLRREDPEVVALGVWAHVHGLVALYLAEKLKLEQEEFRKLYARSVGTLMSAFGASEKPGAAEAAVAR